MSVEEQMSLAEVKARLSEIVDRVHREHDRVVVTKHGHPEVAIVSLEDLESLEETLEILSDPDLMAQIREGERDLAKGRARRLSKEEAEKLARGE